MGYTGLWKATTGRTDPAVPLGHPEYGALHNKPGRDDRIGSRPPYATGKRVVIPPAITDAGTSYDAVLPAQAPPGLLDQEPTTDHDTWEGGGSQTSYQAARDVGNRVRSVDRNSGRSRLLRPLEFDGGTRETDRLQVDPSGDAGRLRALRGKNSLAENNPEGFRIGQRVQRWYMRKIPMHYRTHELRVVRNKLADSARQSPAMPAGNRYTSPFDNIASGKKRTGMSPIQRRTPRAWDEAAVADGTETGIDYSAAGQGLRGWGL